MSPLTIREGWPLYAGMLVAGAAAIVASASTLSSLAKAAGWTAWTPWLLPAALDVGGSAGGWCWLRPGVPEPARRFGRALALTGATGTLLGNAAGHLLTTDYLRPGPVLVVIVGAVPAAMLVALAHLAALLTARRPETDERDTRDVVLQLLDDAPRTVAELATATGRSRSTIVGHLSALTATGAIRRGTDKRYQATP